MRKYFLMLLLVMVTAICLSACKDTDDHSNSTDSTDITESVTANEDTYDIELTHLNESQYLKLKNYGGSTLDIDKYYKIIDDVVEYSDDGDLYFDVCIVFEGKKSECYSKFKEQYYNIEEVSGALLGGVDADNKIGFHLAPHMKIFESGLFQ